MAAAAITEIADELQCPICFEEFTNPKVLHCKHVFCCLCLLKWSKEKNTLTCPVCKAESKLRRGEKIGDLPEPLILTKLQETITRFMTSNLAVIGERTCDLCVQGKAAGYFCHNCGKNMCEQCNQKHASRRPFKNHKVIQLSKSIICSEHKGELKTLYCQDCQLSICNMCFYAAHESHIVNDAQEIVEAKEEFKSFSQSTKQIRNQIVHHVSELKTEKSKLQATYMHVERTLVDMKRKVNDYIDGAVTELQEQLQAEMKNIVFHQTEVENAKAKQENLLKYIDELVNNGSDVDIVTAAKDIPSMCTNVSLVLPTLVTPRVREEEELMRLCQSLVRYGTLGAEKMSVGIVDNNTASGTVLEGTQCTKLWEKKIKCSSTDVLYDEKTGDIWINTNSEAGGLWRYNTRGQLRSKLVKDKKVFYISVDTKRHLFIVTTDTIDAITTINKSGDIIRQVAIGGATDLWGVAYIPDRDMVAVCDHNNHRVWFVEAMSMKVVKQIGSKGPGDDEFNEPCYVCYHGDGHPSPVIVVGDKMNHRVKVIDTQGQFIRSYGSHGSGDRQLNGPAGICVDKKGRIIVSDYGNRRVVRFWHSGGREQWDVVVNTHQLRGLYPRGVCVTDKGHLAIITRTIDDVNEPNPLSHLILFTYQH